MRRRLPINEVYILYEAIERIAKFIHHSESIVVNADVLTDLHRLEVWLEGAIIPASNGNKLTIEDARVAFSECREQNFFSVISQYQHLFNPVIIRIQLIFVSYSSRI